MFNPTDLHPSPRTPPRIEPMEREGIQWRAAFTTMLAIVACVGFVTLLYVAGAR